MFKNIAKMIVQLLFCFDMDATHRCIYTSTWLQLRSHIFRISVNTCWQVNLKSMETSTDGIESVNIASSQNIFRSRYLFCSSVILQLLRVFRSVNHCIIVTM